MRIGYLRETAEEINRQLAAKVRSIRRRCSISQEMLNQISGVSFGSVKRFETAGRISL